jgi:hypothetical protein
MKNLYYLFMLLICTVGYSQHTDDILKHPITYYLPDISYDSKIMTPEQYLGYQIGEQHISHDQALSYVKYLDQASDKVELVEYARSHEKRQLVTLYISSIENLKNKENIRKAHLNMADMNGSLDTNVPLVLYQGYSIHGNEPSGINASMLVAYYLVAGQSPEVKTLLDNCFIIFDPCYNPDGVQRFSNWANSHKGYNLISDPISREYNEMWPGGRTNHYYFDLNRDWLLLTHPESRGRVSHYHKWKPNVLTDHHEMGTNSTFFFQPGVPSRVNHNTPLANQDLTEEIATYHAAALDQIGSLYYSKEGFDDFYIGKGSTYPDVHGAVGILFEQASSRGHYQESVNGKLSFPFTIRNQVVTSLSTQKACVAMKAKLMKFKNDFYKQAKTEAESNPIKGYVLTDNDVAKMNQFADILKIHEIKMYATENDIKIGDKTFPKGSSIVVPLMQNQYKLIKSSFELVRKFQDSLFYDVSAWTLPLAFDLQYAEINSSQLNNLYNNSKAITSLPLDITTNLDKNVYAYTAAWNQAFAPAFTNALLDEGIILKSITENVSTNGLKLEPGTIVIAMSNQVKDKDVMKLLLEKLSKKYQIKLQPLQSGVGMDGLSMGHPSNIAIPQLNVFTIVGNGVASNDVGELWHYMDHRINKAMTMVDKKDISRLDLNRYNTMVLVDGSYSDLPETFIKKLDDWVRKGNKIIAQGNSIDFLKSKALIKLNNPKEETTAPVNLGYAGASNQSGANVVGGSIFNTVADLTHPLCYGIQDAQIALFKQGSTIYTPTENPYATPLKYSKTNTILSGYIPQGFDKKLAGNAAATVHSAGSGTVICFPDNVLFRGYWWGGFRLMSNALFMSQNISNGTKER